MAWRREDKLLLSFIKGEEVNRFEGLDWNLLLDKARREGISSLLYRNLKERDRIVPLRILKELKKDYINTAATNLLLLDELGKVLSALKDELVPVIVLKGGALLDTIYKDIGLRPLTDIDLLIKEEDFPRAQNVLRGMGYRNTPSYPEDFIKGEVIVDLHWDLINITRVRSRKMAHSVELDEIWENSRPTKVANIEARVLSPEDMVMELSLHLTLHHGLSRMVWFMDIALLVSFYSDEIDWDRLVKKSKKYRLMRLLYYTFCYLRELLGVELPEEVITELTPSRWGLGERRLLESIINNEPLEGRKFLLTLYMMESFRDKVRFLSEIILPPPWVLRAVYGDPPSEDPLPCYLNHWRRILSLALNIIKKY